MTDKAQDEKEDGYAVDLQRGVKLPFVKKETLNPIEKLPKCPRCQHDDLVLWDVNEVACRHCGKFLTRVAT